MSQPEHQQVGVSELNLVQRGSIFRAYTEPRTARIPRRYLLLVPAALLLLGVLTYKAVTFEQEATPFRVETHRGLRTVLRGMSPQDVSGILGSPIGRERRGAQECYQYGRPSLKLASYILHTVCYEEGKLRAISERRYNSWVVTNDGAIIPAPLEPEQLVPPASPSAPGLAAPPPP